MSERTSPTAGQNSHPAGQGLPTSGQPDADRRLAAALWDFDGTLADTEPIWIAAEFELIPRLGGEWSEEHAHQLVGGSLPESGAYIAKVIGRDDLHPDWIVDQLLGVVVDHCRTKPIPWRPGALELLESLRVAGVPCALVSASYRELLDVIIDRVPAGSFQASVAGDEVQHGKPDPEPYLTACRKLGVDPQDCVVFEDSPPGAASGGASGATVVVIENVVPVPPAANQVRVRSLAELDANSVAEMVATRQSGAPDVP
ncbi:HAD family hydrolase [Microlunatus soli]|uniref:Haloacid dehalogenase superfamily, subfamily IA, variant 3 with third motif having DD or ED n=1 Tax=Microlunatus soli TaxID=630515 RepID=A0A1H2AHX7_9ACTN|nr:HAD family phosphatase [Microlunatus soli]SDT45615.1 haloacid dehalogenase superfamily, subfamily IA, variant 3 with third motif having DD or ED [Microlunatus soli]